MVGRLKSVWNLLTFLDQLSLTLSIIINFGESGQLVLPREGALSEHA